jgi:hypothetical protein
LFHLIHHLDLAIGMIADNRKLSKRCKGNAAVARGIGSVRRKMLEVPEVEEESAAAAHLIAWFRRKHATLRTDGRLERERADGVDASG